jgi:energy-coupling factor transporter transmembrane protein EcfT
MNLSRHQEHAINALEIFLLIMILGLVSRILRSSLKGWENIYLYVKYMLMILYLGLLANPFVMSLARS